MFSIYIHVPFCKKVCDYCDFRVMPLSPLKGEVLLEEYTQLLCKEILEFENKNPNLLKTAKTLYLGGGTPSLLSLPLLAKIFNCLNQVGVNTYNLQEVSMEFNPESCNIDLLQGVCEFGVNRISMGLQTFDEKLLKMVGRSHSVKVGLDALKLLTECSEKSLQVSADLMFNLPGQTAESFFSDVERLADFPLNHISFYGLNVSCRTKLGQKIDKGILKIDEDLYENMYLGGVKILQKKGFYRYEVSNFARPGFESLHNQNYWNRGEYIGFGPGAHSFINGKRFYAPEIYPRWKDYVKECCPQKSLTFDELNLEDKIIEILWLSLRQERGLDFKELEKVGIRLNESGYKKWLDLGYLELKFTESCQKFAGVKLANRGWIFMDEIVTDMANNYSKLE